MAKRTEKLRKKVIPIGISTSSRKHNTHFKGVGGIKSKGKKSRRKSC